MSPPIKYDYDDNYNPEKHDSTSIDAKVLAWINPGSRVLEIGCSSGYMGKVLWEKDCEVTGVELNPIAAVKREGFYQSMLIGDAEDPKTFDMINGQFDVILCISVLEHLKKPLDILKILSTLLKQNGYFLITLPNIAHWSARWALLRGRFDYEEYGILDNTHLRFFTFQSAQEMINDAGLSILDSYFTPPDRPFFNRLPLVLKKCLLKIYYAYPNLFGYQFLFKAIRR